jgi:hypothetical protein
MNNPLFNAEFLREIKEATKELCEKTGIKNSINGRFIFDKNEVVNSAIFSCNKMEDKYCFGFLLPKEIPVYSGKGDKKRVVGKEQIRSPAIITSSRELIEPSIETENKFKIKYVAIPTEMDLRIDLKIVEDFLNEKNEEVSGLEIYESIKKTYEKFLFFQNPVWYDIHSLWDMGTYFFQLFNSFPILELRGLSGTAKSKVMEVSRLFSLNPTEILVNPSEASLFRITHSNRPTKYIDEAEKLFVYVQGQWQSSPIVELINGSYTKGSCVPRLEKVGNGFKLVSYGCYSPTMLGSITGLREATETRAITHITTKSPDKDSRGELEVKDFSNDKEFQEIRNRLYLYALTNWKQVEENYKNIKLEKIKRRDFQLWKPLLAIAKTLNEELYKRVLEFAERVSEQKKQDFISEGSIDFRVLKIVRELLEQGQSKIYMKSIAEILNRNFTEKTVEKTISNHLDKVGFKDYRRKDMTGSFLQIDKDIFEIIISPICPSLSSYSSYSSFYKGKEEKTNDENMTNYDESLNSRMTNMTKNDEYDDTLYNNDFCFKCQKFLTKEEKEHFKLNERGYCSSCYNQVSRAFKD